MEQVSTSPPLIRRSAIATNVLLIINIALYAALEWSGGPTYENLVRYGAKENGLIASGEWYRLFSPMFLHAGLMHLGFNMWALFQVGRILEFMIGPRSFVILYLVGGVTSTLCSFALSPALSVGASGCLYAVLLALFVLQRYEEHLAKDLGLQVPRSPLGTLIVLNGLITFVIPNIDWAAHLGGAIAGALLGMSIVMRHRWRMRLQRCRPFLDPLSAMPHRRFWEIPQVYSWALALINLAFSFGYFRVTDMDRSFGLGMLRASHITEPAREPTQLAQFGKLITSPQSETNPQKLAAIAVTLHERGLYLPAFLSYHATLLIAENDSGTMNATETLTLHSLMESAYRSAEADTLLLKVIEVPPSIASAPTEALSEHCKQAADLLGQLRFFGIAAKLSETAFLIGSKRSELAAGTFAYLSKGNDLGNVVRFRELASELMPASLDPALTGSALDQKQNEELRRQGYKSVRDLEPSSMWSLGVGNGQPKELQPSPDSQPDGPTQIDPPI